MIFDPGHRRTNRAARIGMALFRLSQAIKKMTQADSDGIGLSPAQIQALLFAFHTRGDVATIGNFASAIGTTHVTAVKIMNGLVEKGLISKSQGTGDRRVTLLRLTASGSKVVAKLDRWGHALEGALGAVPDEVLANFEFGLGAIVSVMQKSGHLAVAEPCMGCIHFVPNAANTDMPHYCTLIAQYLSHEASLKECPEHQSVP